ncbi:carboxymuconolactone decarboxylase family protein [Streptomyces sp. NPDC004726]
MTDRETPAPAARPGPAQAADPEDRAAVDSAPDGPAAPRSEAAPIRVPDALAPLFAHHPEALPLLRQARVGLQSLSGLPPAQVEMVTLAALLAVGAPGEAFHVHVVRARELGLSEGDVWGVFEALAVIVGIPRLVAAVPAVAAALEAVREEGTAHGHGAAHGEGTAREDRAVHGQEAAHGQGAARGEGAGADHEQ